jgi:phage gpG-like protein
LTKHSKSSKNFYIDSFNRQAWLDEKRSVWKSRKKKDGNEKQQGSRAILIGKGSGQLRRSFRAEANGNIATVTNNKPYAQIHNEGGTIETTQNIKQHQRKTKTGKITTVKSHTRSVKITIPQRQFMDIEGQPMSKTLQKRLNLHFQKAIDAAIKNGTP